MTRKEERKFRNTAALLFLAGFTGAEIIQLIREGKL